MNAPEPPRTAGIVSRGTAAIIDLAVVAGIVGLLYLGLTLTALALHPASIRFPSVGLVFSTAVVLSVSVLYLAIAWSVSGCTVGAVAMGLRVIGRRSARVPPLIALLRAIACVLFPIGLAWVAVDRNRRSVQDIVFGSRVIYVRH